ncbi:MAG: rSAM/selenodomain-associated transferase 2 [Roseivirga sp.]|jgi:rSAM/selenodomain-associated transferase 2
MMSVSIIIPTLNEAQELPRLLAHLDQLEPAPLEIIISDGGSSDDTLAIAQRYKVVILHNNKKGRAFQLHQASILAKGDILCFLHADTFPEKNFISTVRATLSNPNIVLGGFRSIMKGVKIRHLITFHNRIKTYYAPFFYNPIQTIFKGLRLLFGDQLMFCRKQDYLKSGGFNAELLIMEEADLCLKMYKMGKIVQLKEKVYSSDRRVLHWGSLKAHSIYILIAMAWGFGFSSEKLAKIYGNIR